MPVPIYAGCNRVRKKPIPLFAKKPSHPSVPLDDPSADARSGGQGRSQTGACALPLTGASTAAPSHRRGDGLSPRLITFLLAGLITIAAPCVPSPAWPAPLETAEKVDPYADHIAEAAERFDIPAAWIRAVIEAESTGDPRATSPRGAMGLMQVMPQTWDAVRTHYDLGNDPSDPRDNILAGAATLREMHDRYGSSGFLAAYNAGSRRYEDYRDRGRPLPAETVAYVAKLAPMIGGKLLEKPSSADPAARPWADAGLFVARSDRRSESVASTSDERVERKRPTTPIADLTAITPRPVGLFVVRSGAGGAP
ncbi:lytic transglycosylase domain-containing protein [Xanthobacter sediminis]